MADSHNPGSDDELQLEVMGRLSDRAIEAWAELLLSADATEQVEESGSTAADNARPG